MTKASDTATGLSILAQWMGPKWQVFVENGPLAEYEGIVWAEEPVVPDPAGRDHDRTAED